MNNKAGEMLDVSERKILDGFLALHRMKRGRG
jgi:hypothetical protein